ncbi:hypothetical protein GCM10009611_06450 [Arthrobacter roseus]
MAESQVRQRINTVTSLVKAGSKSEGRRKDHPQGLGPQYNRGTAQSAQNMSGTTSASQPDQRKSDGMRSFGIHMGEDKPKEGWV